MWRQTSHSRRTTGNLFCTLEYTPSSQCDGIPSIRRVIILVLQEAKSALRFLIHPKLDEIVAPIDLLYIQSLLRDFLERVRLHAEQLFQHLCSLAVGPLLTGTVGEIPTSPSDYALLASCFVPLEC